jgi:hypothetical protein
MEKAKKLGVLVGKFQVPQLHKGHIYVINKVIEVNHQTIIMVGTGESLVKYPLPFECVKDIILNEWRIFGRTSVIPLYDTACNESWSKSLDDTLGALHGESADITLYGGRDSFITNNQYTGKYKCQVIEVPETCKGLSGTEIRAKCISSFKAYTTRHRRSVNQGIIFGVNRALTREKEKE